MEIGSFVIGVMASVVAAWLFWKYQLQVLPKITLCDDISVEEFEDGNLACRFKVINTGKNQVVDITLNAWLTELVTRGGTMVSRAVEQYHIRNTATLTLSSKKEENRPWGLTSELTACFKTDPNLIDALKGENTKIVATLKASDARSRSTIVIQKHFGGENLIFGQFKAHQSVVVLPDERIHSNY